MSRFCLLEDSLTCFASKSRVYFAKSMFVKTLTQNLCLWTLGENGSVFESGLSDAGSAEEIIGMLESLEEKWSSRHQNGKAFHSWLGFWIGTGMAAE